ncbi:transposase [Microcoleus sp. F10-C6]|uniref:transposase n=1 Tax=unclassified Microcoleus TaxID=2642155 RepID=UPI002FCF32AD
MQLVARHVIKPNHRFYREADRLSWLCKNLYNSANYIYRQNIFASQQTNALAVDRAFKTSPDYKALPAKVPQSTIGLVLKAWTSYYLAVRNYQENPTKFKAATQIPPYKGSRERKTEDGRFVFVFNCQAVSKRSLKKGYARPSGANIWLPSKVTSILEIRIVSKVGCYVVEVFCEKLEQPLQVNQRVSEALKSLLPAAQKKSKKLARLWHKRNCKVDYYLHTTSATIIKELVNHQIGLLVRGWNQDFNDGINTGKMRNQNFACIPHRRLLQMLQYKGQVAVIQVVLVEESYTSKCSALDWEPIQQHSDYIASRVKRGLFRTPTGRFINADVNGSLNIGPKAVGDGSIPN